MTAGEGGACARRLRPDRLTASRRGLREATVTAFFNRADRWFIALNKAVLVVLIVAMTALVFVNVVGRYLFGTSFGWAEELSRYAMIWIAFLGFGLALRYGQLVAVEAVQNLLPAAAARALRLVATLLLAAFLVALLLLGIEFVEFSWRNRTPVLRIPRAVPYLAIPVGAGLALVHLAFALRPYLRRDFLTLEELDRDADEPAAAGPDPSGPGRGPA